MLKTGYVKIASRLVTVACSCFMEILIFDQKMKTINAFISEREVRNMKSQNVIFYLQTSTRLPNNLFLNRETPLET
jgi:hypothetical protein